MTWVSDNARERTETGLPRSGWYESRNVSEAETSAGLSTSQEMSWEACVPVALASVGADSQDGREWGQDATGDTPETEVEWLAVAVPEDPSTLELCFAGEAIGTIVIGLQQQPVQRPPSCGTKWRGLEGRWTGG